MKIKTKKEMNLPELIEWGWNNKELSKNKRFTSKNKGGLAIKQSVIFNHFSYAEIENNYCYGPEDTFTVEIEEQITEDTVIPEMLVIGRFDGYDKVYNQKLSSFNQHLLSAYIIHDDGHMELIYDEKKGLVS